MTMDLLRVAAASVGSIIALFVLTKLLGYKRMLQLSCLTTSMASV